MFDFEKLDVYTQARTYVRQVLDYLSAEDLSGDAYLLELLKKSAVRIPILIAEGVGRMVPEEKRQSYKTARSALFESVATLHLLQDLK